MAAAGLSDQPPPPNEAVPEDRGSTQQQQQQGADLPVKAAAHSLCSPSSVPQPAGV